jgi:zona occludens toxin
MPITAYSGLPRSGKSYSVVDRVILPAAKSGRKVFSNIPLNMELINKEFPDNQITQYEMKDVALDPEWFNDEKLNGAIIVMDELWRLWQSGTKANQIPEPQLALIKEHGHRVGHNGMSIELVFVTQDLADLAAAARNMVEMTYRTQKLDHVGANERYRVDIYRGPKVGPEPEATKRVDQTFGKYKKEVYKYYITQTQSLTTGHGDESKQDKTYTAAFRKYIALALIPILLIPVVIYLGIQSVGEKYGMFDEEIEAESIQPLNATKEGVTTQQRREQAGFKFDQIHIVYNNGHYPMIDYLFEVRSGDMVARIDRRAFLQMGYVTAAISNCLVKVTAPNGRVQMALCMPDQEQKGFVQDLVSS